MAVNLRFLGQAAAKQSFGSSLPSVSPRLLAASGGRTPKTPNTSPAGASAFFEDYSKTPKTPAELRAPSFFGDALSRPVAHPSWSIAVTGCDGSPVLGVAGSGSSRCPSRGSPLSSASHASRGSPAAAVAANAWPSLMAGRGSQQAETQEPEAAGPDGARAWFMARKKQVAERWAGGSEQAPDSAALAKLYPVLLGHEVRGHSEALAQDKEAERGLSEAKSGAASAAREAFLARRKNVASRNSGFKV